MKIPLTSACRHCRHYLPEGRRGGVCQQLSVPVQGQWKACSLAVSPFGSSWNNIEELPLWQEQVATLPEPAVAVSEGNACQLTGTSFTEKSLSRLSV
ncbi:hypothetical protein [Tychonema sp. BBK16]|uniref:hypothetical protein n=1 Tax=Tychonema sp. BBK16 TaxID=2699888 RepID=UPI001F3A7798|nr:hypothetical protein [Tychonema sp. BBK16]MCF6371405.1 hypothetical protein [Tychonema sp. BBK16]